MSEKGLFVEPTGDGLYRVKYSGGGEVPGPLSGLYTSYSVANAAIKQHQLIVQASPHIKYPKEKNRGKPGSQD